MLSCTGLFVAVVAVVAVVGRIARVLPTQYSTQGTHAPGVIVLFTTDAK